MRLSILHTNNPSNEETIATKTIVVVISLDKSHCIRNPTTPIVPRLKLHTSVLCDILFFIQLAMIGIEITA